MLTSYRFVVTDTLEKVFPKQMPPSAELPLSGLWGERVSFQLAYYVDYFGTELIEERFRLNIKCPAAKYITQREVVLMPGRVPVSGQHDADYLTTEPTLFPDLLRPIPTDGLRGIYQQWRSIWVELEIAEGTKGDTPIALLAETSSGVTVFETTIPLTVVPAYLPPQKLIHTEHFHCDCLCNYYGIKPFEEPFWSIAEAFLKTAVKRGMNMVLTPLFTPPLDTAVGGERTTVQLVGVQKEHNGYTFDFTLLEKWIDLCDHCGMQYFEMAHLFTQWGLKSAPKIMGLADGKLTRIFGWETDGLGEEYLGFLKVFLPQLRRVLEKKQVLERVWFHISDEPHAEHVARYHTARQMISNAFPDRPIIDALSSFDFYTSGAISLPIVSSNHIEPFLAAKLPALWTYYCCVQGVDVSNRFFAMPSCRNRILGVQLYLYRIQGFLHWGYNFYNAQRSVRQIDPFMETDAGDSFPSGDPFLVYPNSDGTPLESLRLLVLEQAMQDLRALELLESLMGRDAVEQLIREEAGCTITFKQYPRTSAFLLQLRHRVNGLIKDCLSQAACGCET